MVARLIVAELTAILTERADLGVPADCLVWIDGCEAIGRALASGLLALGEATGTSVVLGATDDAAVADLADLVNVLVVRGQAHHHDEVRVRVRRPRPRLVNGCRAVR